MKVVINQDITLAEDARLIKRLYKVQADAEFPLGLKFAYQYLLLKEGKWLEVCRVDNYRHDRHKTGTHIHKHGRQFIEFREMSFKEVEPAIIELGERIRTTMKGEQNGKNRDSA